MSFAFGRSEHDPAALAAHPALDAYGLAAEPPLPLVDRSLQDLTVEAYGNDDDIPDCTAAMLANMARASAWTLGGFLPVVVPEKVPAFFGASIGMPGATRAQLVAAPGAVLLDVLRFQLRNGFDVGSSPESPLVGVPGTVGIADRAGQARAIGRLGACGFGIRLYQRDMDGFGTGPWDDDGTQDQGAIVGRHALFGYAYTGLADGALVQLGTWGVWQPATWRWLARRLDEAHGLFWNQLSYAPGLDREGLRAAVGSLVA